MVNETAIHLPRGAQTAGPWASLPNAFAVTSLAVTDLSPE
jgi:hypothetical protein